MFNFYTIISRIPNYIKRFGVVNGLILLIKIESRKHSTSNIITQYTVPGYDAPIYLRRAIGDHATFWQCIVQVQYDFKRFPQSKQLFQYYERAVKSQDKLLIIDCGANIGLSVIWFAKNFPDAIIYGIEPDSENFELLKKNTAHLGDRIKCLQAAVWDKIQKVNIVNRAAGSAAYRVENFNEDAYDADASNTYTIDKICELADVDSPFIVKIDIEGAQKDLFKSNTQWVAKTHLISLELDDWLMPWAGTSRPFFSCLSKYPFDYLLGGESIFCFRDCYDAMTDDK